MTWPDAVYQSVCAVCWTFVAWRAGAGCLKAIMGSNW